MRGHRSARGMPDISTLTGAAEPGRAGPRGIQGDWAGIWYTAKMAGDAREVAVIAVISQGGSWVRAAGGSRGLRESRLDDRPRWQRSVGLFGIWRVGEQFSCSWQSEIYRRGRRSAL